MLSTVYEFVVGFHCRLIMKAYMYNISVFFDIREKDIYSKLTKLRNHSPAKR